MGSHCNQVGMSRVSLVVVFLLAAAVSARKQVERHPKLFFVSTSSTTSTLSTATLCYITTTPFSNSCTGRKRRAINFEGASVDESELSPSQLKEDVQSSMEKNSLDRQGRFLLYWTTTTSFTTTFSIFSVFCTPTGASECG